MEMDKNTVVEMVARVCHQVNKALCESFGDFSQSEWEDAEDWQKESSRTQVAFLIENPDAPPSALHDSWMKEKYNDGWVYGEVKDAEAKTHPCLVDFDKLPGQQQAKDRVFSAVVQSFSDIGRIYG